MRHGTRTRTYIHCTRTHAHTCTHTPRFRLFRLVHGLPPGIFRCRGNLPLHNSVGLEPLTHERICQIPGRARRNLSNPDLVKNLVKSLGAPRNLTNLILSKILSNLPRNVMGPRRHRSITACAGGYQSLSNFIQLRLRPFSTALMTLPRQAAARSDLTARGRPAATHVHQKGAEQGRSPCCAPAPCRCQPSVTSIIWRQDMVNAHLLRHPRRRREVRLRCP